MKKNTTKRSLALSVLSLVLCVAMLLGTTFAWFTDSVTSGVNTIVAGNLDIELEALVGGEWIPVTNTTKLFKDGALWEPGYTEVAYLRLSNKGTLALKYQLAINISNEVAGTNAAGDSFKLSDYIKMGVVENWDGETVYADRAAARAVVSEAGNIATYAKTGEMTASAQPFTFAIVAYMPEEVGNVANYKTGTTAPSIEMGVNVVATQLTSESDSFDNQYDKAAWIVANADHTAKDASELQNALAQGGTVALTNDITGNLTFDNLGDGAEVALAGSKVTGTVTAKDDITISGSGTIANTGMNNVPLKASTPGKTLTVDGIDIVSGQSQAVDLADGSKLAFKSGSVERTVPSTSSGSNHLIMANDDAEIEIAGGSFINQNGGSNERIIKFDDKAGKAAISGGEFVAGKNASSSGANIVYLDGDVVGDVHITGGDFVVNGSNNAIIQGGKEGTKVVIDGGNFKVGNTSYLVYSSYADVVINDCTFVSDMSISSSSPKRSYIFNVSGTAKVTINGGTYTLDKTAGTIRIVSSLDQKGNVILKGGTFNVKPSESATIAEGFKEVDNGDGTWTVVAE